MPIFIMMVGVPNSGKTTYAKTLINTDVNNSYTYISRDDLVELAGSQLGLGELTYNEAWAKVDQKHVDTLLNARIESAFLNKENVILDMTNLTKKARAGRLKKVPQGYKKMSATFICNEKDIFERNKQRPGKVIPPHVISTMMEQFEIPTKDEGFDILATFDEA